MHIMLKSLLREAMELLYHATAPHTLLKILQSDALKFTYADATHSEMGYSKGYPFYLSTSREKFGGYARLGGSTVVLVLNGRAFEKSQGTKMISMDYWEGMRAQRNITHNETEERILSNNQVFKGLSKYILEIHVFCKRRMFDPKVDSTYRSNHFINNIVYPIIELSKTSHVPTYFYIEGTNANSEMVFRMQRKEQSLSPEQAKKFFEEFQDSSEELKAFKATATPEELAVLQDRPYGYSEKYTQEIKYLIDILDHPEKYNDNDVRHTSELEKVLGYFGRWHMDSLDHFSALIGNMRDKHPEIFQELAKCIRRNKYKKIADALKNTTVIFNVLYAVKTGWKNTSPSYKKLIDLKYDYRMKDLDDTKRNEILDFLKEFKEQKELSEPIYKKIVDIIRK